MTDTETNTDRRGYQVGELLKGVAPYVGADTLQQNEELARQAIICLVDYSMHAVLHEQAKPLLGSWLNSLISSHKKGDDGALFRHMLSINPLNSVLGRALERPLSKAPAHLRTRRREQLEVGLELMLQKVANDYVPYGINRFVSNEMMESERLISKLGSANSTQGDIIDSYDHVLRMRAINDVLAAWGEPRQDDEELRPGMIVRTTKEIVTDYCEGPNGEPAHESEVTPKGALGFIWRYSYGPDGKPIFLAKFLDHTKPDGLGWGSDVSKEDVEIVLIPEGI